jgi:tripartite motif-containing protein 71
MSDSGNLYIVDSGNYSIKFSTSSGSSPSPPLGSFSDPSFNSWGSQGSEDGQFDGPTGISTDSQGMVYVADTGNNRIQKFDSNGVFILKWGSKGSGDGQFIGPSGITVDSSANVYVADSGNNRIEKFAIPNSPAG